MKKSGFARAGHRKAAQQKNANVGLVGVPKEHVHANTAIGK